MRSEKEMFDLILNVAKKDSRILAVVMNGSRVNPNVPKDIFQDYDIVYVVKDVKDFLEDRSWIINFGELMIMQTPDEMGDSYNNHDERFCFLMQFIDGNRIDLTFYSVEKTEDLKQDSLSKILLDKEGILGTFPPPSEKDYLPKPPTKKEFQDCCNEFWWVNPYIAKGIWREELSYAKFMFDGPVRKMFMKMLTWYIGIETDFKKSPGKLGKYFKNYLKPKEWNEFILTYSDGNYENMWESLFAMNKLFRETATKVGKHFGYDYPCGDDKRVTAHLKHVKTLPRDAKKMY
ncbi:aminoglycoside 6-adenylyltransferase [Dethiothermospora halolimnae]|uniref:aminoglycoside 6-adenylyltransferase n=1 Tax=Dethiothermospora halolimnae TaxID=3114390 RepID=UPI003CCBF188